MLAAILVIAMTVAGSLTAACGGSDDRDRTPAAKPTLAAPSATPSAETAAASPTLSAAAPSPVATDPPSTAAASPTPRPPAGGRSVTISAVGDVSLARQVNDWMAMNGAAYPYQLIAHLLTGDIVFGNLEGALTDRGEAWPKAFNFRTPPQYAGGLASAGFDVVALANNHAMDYGTVGLEDTIAALDAAGVPHVGAGGPNAAWAPRVVEANGLRVAFLACALTPPEGSGFTIDQWAIGALTPGMAVCTQDLIAQAVGFAAASSDFVVISIHAGDEYVNAPNGTQRALSEGALAAGADVVLGHHAHVVQPVEHRGGQLIAWGLGNFIFDLDQWDLAGIPEPRVAPILNITLTEGAGVTAWESLPVVLDAEQDRPRPATLEEGAVLQSLLIP